MGFEFNIKIVEYYCYIRIKATSVCIYPRNLFSGETEERINRNVHVPLRPVDSNVHRPLSKKSFYPPYCDRRMNRLHIKNKKKIC